MALDAATVSLLLHSGMDVCSTSVEGREGLIGGLFLTGLVGSLTHCSGMCGPFVLSQVAGRLQHLPPAGFSEWRRLAGAALVPYHLGRGLTYAALGALGGAFAGAVGQGSGWRWLAVGLMAVAALLLMSLALPMLRAGKGGGQSRLAALVGRVAKPLFATPTGWRGLGLGVALGFLPCGLLYAALAAAAAAGNAVAGAAAMLAFAAGTVPMLLLVGWVGHAAVAHWRGPLLRLAPALLVANAGVLGVMAWRLAAL
jgi:sulfite exporter TauE/SafE